MTDELNAIEGVEVISTAELKKQRDELKAENERLRRKLTGVIMYGEGLITGGQLENNPQSVKIGKAIIEAVTEEAIFESEG